MAYQYKREPLTEAEAHRLRHECRTELEQLVVWTLLDTGLRVGELGALTRANVDFTNHRLMIYGKGGPFGKRSKLRVIPLSPVVAGLLEPVLAREGGFPVGRRQMQRIVSDVALRAKIEREVTPHVLRHTFAVTWNRKGGSLPVLQRLLGHDHLATKQIYLNLSPEDVVREFHAKW